MSQVGYTVVQASPWSAATGVKTVLLALAGANSGLVIAEFGISFDGITPTAVPALVELVSTTAATAGTSGETPTITQTRGRVTGGEPPTGGSKYTAEPTVLVRHKAWYVRQDGGLLILQYPLGREPETDDSGGAIRGYGIRVNTSATVNVMSYLEVEKNG